MQEIELKLVLDAAQERRLRKSAVLRSRGVGRARTETLQSYYFDTDDSALRAAGIALRLRNTGRHWVQTVKRRSGVMHLGLSTPQEDECTVDGNALELSRIADHDLREEVIGLARAGVRVVAETRFRRTTRRLRAASGAEVELAIDVGEVSAQGASLPLIEVELELVTGHPGDLYTLAAEIFPTGPIRFSETSKSERALTLGQGAEAPSAGTLRKARRVQLEPGAMVEDGARAILSEGLSHALPNLQRTLEVDDAGGPHQLRVALRRLRSAFSAFRPALGQAGLEIWGGRARDIAALAGEIRDLDVLASDLIDPMAERIPSEPGFAALRAAVTARRAETAAKVRKALITPEHTAFGFGFAAFLATRGWIDPTDHTQTMRLAEPVSVFAGRAIARRWKGLARYGNRIADLTIEERHEMRKELKKLRYVIDAFQSVFEEKAVAVFLKRVKRLQAAFGALNDSAMAETLLMAPDAPGAGDAAAQRAAGRLIGYLTSESDRLWPDAIAGWQALSTQSRFWKSG